MSGPSSIRKPNLLLQPNTLLVLNTLQQVNEVIKPAQNLSSPDEQATDTE